MYMQFWLSSDVVLIFVFLISLIVFELQMMHLLWRARWVDAGCKKKNCLNPSLVLGKLLFFGWYVVWRSIARRENAGLYDFMVDITFFTSAATGNSVLLLGCYRNMMRIAVSNWYWASDWSLLSVWGFLDLFWWSTSLKGPPSLSESVMVGWVMGVVSYVNRRSFQYQEGGVLKS